MWLTRLVAAATILLIGIPALLWVATPDATPPRNLGAPLGEFGSVLATQLDMPPLTHARFVRHESDGDGTLILVFDLRSYPYVAGRLAYLVARCVPPSDLEPRSMGGGFVEGTTETDPELVHLRSDAQPPCLPDRIVPFADD